MLIFGNGLIILLCNGETIQFKKDTLKRVSEQEMFKWLELAHTDKIKISIYEAKMVCDLS